MPMPDSFLLAQLIKKGLVPDPNAGKAPAPPAPEDSPFTNAPDLPAPPERGPMSAPPVATRVAPAAPAPNGTGDMDAKNTLAVAMAGLGDAISASGGHSTNTAKTTLDTIQNAPARAAERAETIRKAQDLAESDDPTSPISKFHQMMAAKYTGKDPSEFAGANATQIGKIFPTIEKMWQADETNKTRKDIADDNRAMRESILKQGEDMKNVTLGMRQDQQQDKLEGQAIQRITGVRGDASMAKIEAQRDASIQAYNTIKQIKKEGRMPSQIEYYDILGQLWKARTGASPTDQAIKDLDAKTFKGDLAKAAQYFSGKPTGRTTEAILDNIQNFAKSSGEQADKLHAGYMGSKLIKPKGLDDDRWQNIMKTHRGLSFAEATKGDEGPQAQLLFAKNPQTGQRLQSIDGGQSWQPAQ